jgi:hypothetical protein
VTKTKYRSVYNTFVVQRVKDIIQDPLYFISFFVKVEHGGD